MEDILKDFLTPEVSKAEILEEKRLAGNQFRKTARNQLLFQKYLIHYINTHKNGIFPMTSEEINALPYETLLELTIGVVNTKLSVESFTTGRRGGHCSWDFSDKSDAKSCIARYHGNSFGAAVTGITTKDLLRVLVLCSETEKFYTFVFPKSAHEHLGYSIEIPFTKTFLPYKRGENYWSYEVNTFEKMCFADTSDYKPSANNLYEMASR